jgi:hypothetical protein
MEKKDRMTKVLDDLIGGRGLPLRMRLCSCTTLFTAFF